MAAAQAHAALAQAMPVGVLSVLSRTSVSHIFASASRCAAAPAA
jgi:hypothetical protein